MTKNQLLKYSKMLYSLHYKGRYCQHCGYDGFENPWIMEYHHTDPKFKEFNVKNKTVSSDFNKIKSELDKCILLCSHCHKTLHSKITEYNHYKDTILERLQDIINLNGQTSTKNPLSTEDKEFILNNHKNMTILEISKELNRKYDSVKSFLYNHNLKSVREKKSNKLPTSEIIKLYNSKYSIRKIANIYNVSPSVITDIILKNNLPIRQKKIINPTAIEKLVKEGLTNQEISSKLDCKPSSIWRIRKRLSL